MKALKTHAACLGQREEVLEVILFGSLVNETYSATSDADMLIVLKDSDKPFLDRLVDFMAPDLPLDTDIFPYTQAELARMLEAGNPFIRKALAQGLTLWKRSNEKGKEDG